MRLIIVGRREALGVIGRGELIGDLLEIYPEVIPIEAGPPEPYVDIAPLLDRPKTHPTSPRESTRRMK